MYERTQGWTTGRTVHGWEDKNGWRDGKTGRCMDDKYSHTDKGRINECEVGHVDSCMNRSVNDKDGRKAGWIEGDRYMKFGIDGGGNIKETSNSWNMRNKKSSYLFNQCLPGMTVTIQILENMIPVPLSCTNQSLDISR